MLKQWIIGEGKPSDKKLFIWNMIGSAVYALASLVLTYMTIRVIGDNEGGIFAIALTLAQMFIYVAYYEMRNYQVTDVAQKYSFCDYHTVKIFNCFLMLVITVLYCFIKDYNAYKFLIVFLVCVYRMLDGYADVYEAEFHAQNRLDLAGKSMTFRTLFSVGLYFIILIITKNLLLALIGAIISGIIGVWIFNVWIFDCVGKICIRLSWQQFVGILKDCFPLFLGMFLWTYLLSASRIAVDDVMSSQYQSYYQILFLPVSVINLLAGFLIRPSLISLTELHFNGEKKVFWKKISGMLGLLTVFTLICMVGAFVCGIPILNLLVSCDLSEYRNLFVFLIFSGGFNAVAYLLYYVLTIFRNGKSILIGYILASVVALVISPIMVRKYALWGAGESYLLSIIVLLMVFVISILCEELKPQKRSKEIRK